MRLAALVILAALAGFGNAFADPLDTLTFTAPTLEPAEGRCDTSFGIPERGPLVVLLERLRSTSYDWQVIDSLVGMAPGSHGVLIVDLTGCRPCAFRVWTRDQAGNMGCAPSRAVNLADSSASPVGVPPAPPPAGPLELRVYDLAGRRINRPLELLPSGWYALRWLRSGRVVTRRDTVLIR
jgi:hypothetical protein